MEDKLRIAETIDAYIPDIDGVVSCVHNYSINLKDKAYITVLAPKNKKNYVDDQPYRILRCTSMRVPIINDFYGFPKLDSKFNKIIKDEKFDIIHAHSPFNMGFYAVKIAREKGIPAVATFHSNMRAIIESVIKSSKITNFSVSKMGDLYNKFDEVFVCSQRVEEQLRSYGYTGKVSYLPFGTDFEKCNNVGELSIKANAEFNIKENELVLIYIGRIMKLKRIDFILKSLKIAKEKGLKFRFFIVGQGMELNNLEKLSKDLGFTEKEVYFTHFLSRDKLPLIYARGDLLLFPSLYDNFGLVKLECSSYATAGVFIKNSCAGDDIIDGENGFLSDDSETSFAETIIKASSDLRKLRNIGKRAQETLYMHWNTCADILLENYKRVIQEYDNKK